MIYHDGAIACDVCESIARDAARNEVPEPIAGPLMRAIVIHEGCTFGDAMDVEICEHCAVVTRGDRARDGDGTSQRRVARCARVDHSRRGFLNPRRKAMATRTAAPANVTRRINQFYIATGPAELVRPVCEQEVRDVLVSMAQTQHVNRKIVADALARVSAAPIELTVIELAYLHHGACGERIERFMAARGVVREYRYVPRTVKQHRGAE